MMIATMRIRKLYNFHAEFTYHKYPTLLGNATSLYLLSHSLIAVDTLALRNAFIILEIFVLSVISVYISSQCSIIHNLAMVIYVCFLYHSS